MPGAGSARNAPPEYQVNGKHNGTSIVPQNLLEAPGQRHNEARVFAKRWAILAMFCILSASNGAQWIIYAIISPTIVDFYGVSYAAVNWTSMVYMLTYIFFFIPAAWVFYYYQRF
ncbi:unnamed protein product, partial [Mesorhabditis spiculigera]